MVASAILIVGIGAWSHPVQGRSARHFLFFAMGPYQVSRGGDDCKTS
jgi:hypothetical protein